MKKIYILKYIFVICILFGIYHPIAALAQTGSCGSYDVAAIQRIVGVTADGICGPNTITGIKQWQSQHNLNADGIVGPETAQTMGLTGTFGGSGTNPPTQPSNSNSNNSASTLCDHPLQNGLCIPQSPFGGIAGKGTFADLVSEVLKILLTLVGVIAVIFIIVGGFQYMTAGGNEEQAEKGRKALTNAIIGLVIVILAYVIVQVITNLLTGTTGF